MSHVTIITPSRHAAPHHTCRFDAQMPIGTLRDDRSAGAKITLFTTVR
jgi:hypothetical protein